MMDSPSTFIAPETRPVTNLKPSTDVISDSTFFVATVLLNHALRIVSAPKLTATVTAQTPVDTVKNKHSCSRVQ